MSDKPATPGTGSPPSPSTAPTRRFTDVPNPPVTVIGSGIRIKGLLVGDGPIEVAGSLEGNCKVTGLFRVREGARIVGNVTATSIVIEGEVLGQTLVAEKVEIGASGSVRANIRAHLIAMAEGAFFEGGVNLDGYEGAATAQTFKEKRKGPREGGKPPGGVGSPGAPSSGGGPPSQD